MALLTLKERKAAFKELGLTYNKGSIEALQRKYMWRKSDVDGIYGKDTDNMVRTIINVQRYASKNFSPEEFRCECKGKYCCGFPSYMKPHELISIQAIRDHWNRPVKVTCGMRDATYNRKLNGSVQNSRHLTGQAIDFYQKGVTDTLANRKMAIKWMKKNLPYLNYAYGNGINSNGYKVKAPYMGNALHVDTK